MIVSRTSGREGRECFVSVYRICFANNGIILKFISEVGDGLRLTIFASYLWEATIDLDLPFNMMQGWKGIAQSTKFCITNSGTSQRVQISCSSACDVLAEGWIPVLPAG
jgi:hypothetical protein